MALGSSQLVVVAPAPFVGASTEYPEDGELDRSTLYPPARAPEAFIQSSPTSSVPTTHTTGRSVRLGAPFDQLVALVAAAV